MIAGLRQAWGDQIPIDLVTCYASLPKGFEPHNTRVYRVGDYRGRAARGRLYRELAGNRYALVGIICSGEIVMAKWKWVLALRIPAKLFIINENGDYFWFDRHAPGHDPPICALSLRPGGVGRGAHAGAPDFLPVHFAVSVTLCNVRPCPSGDAQKAEL